MTLLLTNYIENDKEWVMPSDLSMINNREKVVNNDSISDVIKRHLHLPGDFQLIMDDDYNVYLLVLNDSDDDFEALENIGSEYGCTCVVYYSRGTKTWSWL